MTCLKVNDVSHIFYVFFLIGKSIVNIPGQTKHYLSNYLYISSTTHIGIDKLDDKEMKGYANT